ncbi:MAG: poly-beta-1,6-N-acetyl-D-glucosamine biosynthesis protein PgaD [Nitrospirota bacterium]|nr:poly-beta-1,6-N-acetyl-D-glucosamine biosynthesis protein PgaD [Nitrospirota bacterium]
MIDDHLIIDDPSLQRPRERRWSQAFTLLFWLLWFALWIPVVNLGAWLLGHEFLYLPQELFFGRLQFLQMVTWHAAVIGLIPVTLIGWGAYNQMKFGHHERRVHPSTVDVEQVASAFQVDPRALIQWQHQRRVVIRFDGDRIAGVETGPPRSGQ